MRKKVILFLMLMLFTVSISAQVNNMRDYNQRELSYGLSFTNINSLKSSPTGISFGFDYDWFHIDCATNFASGEGEYLEFESSQSYKEDKRSWYLLNFGVNIQTSENVILTPKIGYAYVEDIYTDPIGDDTYFMKHHDTKFNMGAIAKYSMDNITLHVGSGLVETVYIGVGFNF